MMKFSSPGFGVVITVSVRILGSRLSRRQTQRSSEAQAVLRTGALITAAAATPGTAALAAKYKDRQPPGTGGAGDRQDLTPQSIRFFARQGVSVMAPFRKTEISDAISACCQCF